VTSYLADTSIWSWGQSGQRRDITERLAARHERGELITCAPVALESQPRARTGAEYDRFFQLFYAPLHWVPCGEATFLRALEVQRSLAHAGDGRHRRPAIDYVIAAAAELGNIVLWAFDRDMRVICEHTGQPCELESPDP